MRCRFLLGLLAALLLVLDSVAPLRADQRDLAATPRAAPPVVPISGEYWALIIGIDRYRHVPPLTTAVRDAQAVREVLVQRYGFKPDHVVTLLDEQATRTAIEDALYRLGQDAGEPDSVLIYYAGHGQTDAGKTRGWWVPVDGREKSPGTYITNASIRDYIAGMKAKHVYLVADSCFSGTLFGQARDLPPIDDRFYATLYANKSRWGLTSGMNQPVADDGKDGHSVFAYFFLKFLRENREPYVAPSDIYKAIARVVRNNSEQQPLSQPLKHAGDEDGQFVFRLVSASGGPVPPSSRPSAPSLSAPPAQGVDLGAYDDLERIREAARKREQAWAKVKGFAGDTGIAREKRLAALDKFLADFADDNPHVGEVEALKQQIAAEIQVAKAPAFEAPRQAGREITGKDGAPMVLIPAGEFLMGSTEGEPGEKPVHRVSLDAFYLDKYEVTNKRFQQFVRETGYETTAEKAGTAWGVTAGGRWEEIRGASWRKPEGGETVFVTNRDEHPVVAVSWDDAEAYCRWAGKRLPTEAEFEYANRGGTRTTYWWGDGHPGSRRVANIADETAKRQFSGWTIITGYDDGYARTAPVGSFEPNPFGLYDTTGNVVEWTADWYGADYYGRSPQRNPTGPSSGEGRVLRGGSWTNDPVRLRSANRLGSVPP